MGVGKHYPRGTEAQGQLTLQGHMGSQWPRQELSPDVLTPTPVPYLLDRPSAPRGALAT